MSRVNFLFFFRVTLVTIAIMFHKPILILTLWLVVLRASGLKATSSEA